MEDFEIVQFAESIVKTITKDLNESLYSEPKSSLSVLWKRCDVFNASAIPKSELNEPPVDIITINYGLALQMYHDIDEYCTYIESGFDNELFSFFSRIILTNQYYLLILNLKTIEKTCL